VNLNNSQRVIGCIGKTRCTALFLSDSTASRYLVTAVKCGVDTSLRKKRLTPSDTGSTDELKTSHTMISTCDQEGHQTERFEDGLTMEKIKCTSVSTTDKWSREESDCAGELRHYFRVSSFRLQQSTWY